jgi:hypothetical protein
MSSIRNLKSTQFKKLLRKFKSSRLQNWSIFGAIEDVYFEFASWSYFWKCLKPGGAQPSAPVPTGFNLTAHHHL